MAPPRKNARRTPGKPFKKGNPGRPKGARNKVTRAVEELLDGDAEALTRKAIELALAGDTTALRLCLERLCPPRKERVVILDLPALKGIKDVPAVAAEILRAVGNGEITPGEGQALSALVEGHTRAVELVDLDQRLKALEANGG